MFGFPHWQLKSTSTETGVVAPDERLPLGQTMVMGVQHAVAMFGATVLMPMLMGLDPNLSYSDVGYRYPAVLFRHRRARAQLSRIQRRLCGRRHRHYPGLTARGSTPT